jgi:ATP-dependent helicase/nuclease subunit A
LRAATSGRPYYILLIPACFSWKITIEKEMQQKISLADEAERGIVRNDLDRSLSVEAGAGTGKTTLLVDRILSLLRERRAPLEEIVAITFTEKAAGELKVRLREAIEKALPLSPPAEAESLNQALGELERAPISTIHSFCASLLPERPVEASLDPNFKPLDEMGMDLLFQETWDQWLVKEMEKKPAVLRRALALGMEMDSLARLVRQIYENRDLLPEVPLPQPPCALPSSAFPMKRSSSSPLLATG